MSLFPTKTWPDFIDLFDSPLVGLGRTSGHARFSPRADVVEKEDQFEVYMDLPGVNKNDITLTCQKGTLTIEAVINQERDLKEGEKIVHQERYSGKIHRQFSLGHRLVQEDIQASFQDGVLSILVPKNNIASEEVNRIEIR